MSYTALYRMWRPSVFEDVVEQEHVVKTLRNSINSGRIAHAYLFCGTRGTGKTTMAKIFSRAINCLHPKSGDPCNECEICKGILSDSILDVVEIDAASNNSVDNIREIRDEVIYAPSQAKYKVYIIDEVHMLSSGAFNALLKTLEEPPEHVVFILATTDPHKLPATILSRCQRFDFRRISIDSIVSRITSIAEANSIIIKKEPARLIARLADGALRDAISILDQCISMGNPEIKLEDVLLVVGLVNDDFIAELVDAINEKNIEGILKLIEKLIQDGKSIVQFVSDLVTYYRNLLICKVTQKPEEIIDATAEVIGKMIEQSKIKTQDETVQIIKEFSALETSLKWASQPRILLEVALVKICSSSSNAYNAEHLMERLSALEQKINSGPFVSGTTSEQKQVVQNSKSPVLQKTNEPRSETVLKSEVKAVVKASSLENWEDVIKEFKNSGRMVIYTNLLGTRAVVLEDNVVGVVFSTNGFNKMIMSKPENLEAVEVMLTKKNGREFRVKCIEESEVAQNAKKITGDKVEEKDDFMEKAKGIASRLNIPMNIIDE